MTSNVGPVIALAKTNSLASLANYSCKYQARTIPTCHADREVLDPNFGCWKSLLVVSVGIRPDGKHMAVPERPAARIAAVPRAKVVLRCPEFKTRTPQRNVRNQI
eukprot:SAG31_NODE_7304_length_1724_cov_1.875692_1_plen_105_part_00